VSGRVGNDEVAPRGGEVAVGDIDRDSLFALGGQPVGQQREVEFAPLGAGGLRVGLQRRQLIGVQGLGLVEQPPDQRALAVVDRAAEKKPQEGLVLVRGEQIADVGRLWARAQK
jgi:hypothetical protein